MHMLTTVLDPSQFGGRVLLVGHRNGQCTIFSGLIERRLRISQGGGGREDRPVHKRLEDFQRIARRLMKDLGKRDFAAFSEHFPGLKCGPRFALVSGAKANLRFGNQGPRFDADRPFVLDELLPCVSPDELQTAKLRFEDTKEAVESMRRGPTPFYYGIAHRPNIPRGPVQTISDVLDGAMERAHHRYDAHHSTSSSSSRRRDPSW